MPPCSACEDVGGLALCDEHHRHSARHRLVELRWHRTPEAKAEGHQRDICGGEDRRNIVAIDRLEEPNVLQATRLGVSDESGLQRAVTDQHDGDS